MVWCSIMYLWWLLHQLYHWSIHQLRSLYFSGILAEHFVQLQLYADDSQIFPIYSIWLIITYPVYRDCCSSKVITLKHLCFLFIGYDFIRWGRDDRDGGTWWHIGWVDSFQPEGRGFDSRSFHHIGTLGKSLTHSCLWRFGVKLWYSICDVLEALLRRSGLEEVL